MTIKAKVKVEKKSKYLEIITSSVQELFSLLGVEASFEVREDTINEAVLVSVDAKDSTGLLIGRHGETLSALQHILSLIVRQELGEFKRVIVNVGDWREKQEESLKALATSAADRAIETGQDQPIYNLTAAQRRIVHMTLSERPDIITESTGEDSERFLVVKPKSKA